MYNIKSGTDLSFMLGKRLQQVCFGLHDVILNFLPTMHISVFNQMKLESKGENTYLWESGDRSITSFPIQLILEREIVGVSIEQQNNIKILFEGSFELMLIDNFSATESVNIICDEKYIVV